MTAPRFEDIEGVRQRLQELVESGNMDAVGELLQELHPSDVADLVESLDSDDDRVALLQVLPKELASETLVEMDEEEDPGEILAALDPKKGAELLQELEVDDAVEEARGIMFTQHERFLMSGRKSEVAIEVASLTVGQRA